ncbi:MAG TPA: CDP-alcohol phosphatidyltransferase family protein [Vicinamibacterales bacterium]|jgi:phosphatidylcholine synthase|nr:CDP-alcohol phosphatidyltransferase family protein [Vicinamibacterales bacterium]
MPWVAHLYTALGAVLALAATLAVFDGRFRDVFLLLALATFIDTTDGWLARGLRVKERLPGYDGARLDDIVDYLTYVFVPVLLVMRAGLLPSGSGLAVGALVLLASAYGFGQVEAKVATSDHFFTGFPSYWNIVALYLYVWRLPEVANAVLLSALAVLVFVPIRYVYPSRTVTLRVPTLVLGAIWALLVLVAMWRLPATGGPWLNLSLVFPVYYTALSFYLHAQQQTD